MHVNIPSSRILALETSAERCSASLRIGSDVCSFDEPAGRTHSELLLPMVERLLLQSDLTVGDLDAIAFGAGPGSFTGLRIACGVAQGLAFAAGHMVVPVGTLEALAEASGGVRVVVCTDARMGQVYHAAFERNGDKWEEIVAPNLCAPEQLPDLPGGDWLGCGSGFERYPQSVRARYQGKLRDVKPGVIPHAREIALLGAQYLAERRGVPATAAAPVYVRNKVALTMLEQQ